MSEENEEYDPYATNSSGGLESFTGEIVESEFSTDPNYNNGETLSLTWLVEIKDEDLIANGIETRQVSFSCGTEWVSEDGGSTATFGDGSAAANFRSASKMGMLVQRSFSTGFHNNDPTGKDKGKEVSLGLLEDWKANGFVPTQADPWIGYTFRFERHHHNYGGEIGVRSFDMPVEVIQDPPPPLSAASTPPKKKAPAKKKAAKKKAADKSDAPSVSQEEMTEKVHDLIGTMDEDASYNEYEEAVSELLTTYNWHLDSDYLLWVVNETEGPWSEY